MRADGTQSVPAGRMDEPTPPESLHFEQLFYWYAAASLLLGVYLTYGARGTNRGQAAPS